MKFFIPCPETCNLTKYTKHNYYSRAEVVPKQFTITSYRDLQGSCLKTHKTVNF